MEFNWDKTGITATDFFAPMINYSMLQDTATYKEMQADALEVKVQEQINMMRESFLESVGAYQAQVATRGFKVGEGTAKDMVEQSAIAMGEDVQKAKKNVEYKKKMARASAKIDRANATAQMGMGALNIATKLAGGIS